MGCLNSKESRASKYAVSGGNDDDANIAEALPGSSPAKAPSSEVTPAAKETATGKIKNLPRPRLDPKDFQLVGCKGEVKVKLPGSINGQAYVIDKCEDCDIYVLDYCAQVTIDECKGCRIYIGPTDGAVFVRDCSGCSLAVVSRQLRTRDCHDCRISLHCRTKPVVESSTNVGFACFDLPYPELADHMRQAKLGLFHNFWWHVYDFTPKPGNWQLLPPDVTAASLLQPLPQEVAERFVMTPGKEGQQEESSGSKQESPVLMTFGNRQPRPDGRSYLFVAFEGGKSEKALQLARSASEKGWLLHTNEVRLGPEAAAALAAEAGWSKAAGKALSGGGKAACVGLELAVPEGEEVAALRARVKALGGQCSDSEAAGKSFRTQGVDG
ncbi:hypothetical protein Agub_g1444 [Astrephomene gubernaculifera]|uniref:C-CAP/cofactor C-like domain-containing protein n=1 Tax=Astrephomene gubernaculifera TaxID=47775 RepID=A0AAD3HHJ1_9CHLO|nr:hypothetical protein Agub_g1444 [Astrephomene gubernaculifera]